MSWWAIGCRATLYIQLVLALPNRRSPLQRVRNILRFLRCPNCGSEDFMGNDTTRRATKTIKCRDCSRQFVENPQWKRREPDTTATIDRLLLEKIPLAGIARVLKF